MFYKTILTPHYFTKCHVLALAMTYLLRPIGNYIFTFENKIKARTHATKINLDQK
jgi:hypothetical protein